MNEKENGSPVDGEWNQRLDAARLAAVNHVPSAPSCPQIRLNRAESADSPVGALASLALRLTIIARVTP